MRYFFAALRETIVPLLAAIKERGSAIRTDFLYQNWPIEQQRKLSKKIMEVWGLDPDHCVLGETEHPFTSGFWHGDVRITTIICRRICSPTCTAWRTRRPCPV